MVLEPVYYSGRLHVLESAFDGKFLSLFQRFALSAYRFISAVRRQRFVDEFFSALDTRGRCLPLQLPDSLPTCP
jgi:hypothetical protein